MFCDFTGPSVEGVTLTGTREIDSRERMLSVVVNALIVCAVAVCVRFSGEAEVNIREFDE